jgi:branched-chain amino acid transport system ATP-binding protein
MLKLENIVVKYGVAVALQGVSLEVEKADRVALLGANGAGKSTIVNAISGIEPLAAGRVLFEGTAISGWPPHRIVELGIAQIPEGRLVFPRMTVWENLELGSTPIKDRQRKKELQKQVFALFPRLEERRKQEAGTLSGGEQQMLAFGRTLMSNPKLILSDEVSMGLAPVVVRELYNTLLRINAEWKVTLLIVEQDAKLALNVARHAHVLETEKIVASGPSEELARNDVVRKVYLGEE